MPPIVTLRARNPGPFTGTGTNTYVLGEDQLVVVDPGPDRADHLRTILKALEGRPLAGILVTHAHLDHSALAPRLSHETGAPVLAFGTATSGVSAKMLALVAEGLIAGEGVDHAFVPDQTLVDGQIFSLGGIGFEAIHTPGHMANHLAFAMGDTLFSGDHVMGWSTSSVSPPEGDMGDYMAALRKLQGRSWQRFLPGHGEPVLQPATRLAELIAHRQDREAAILQTLAGQGPASAMEIARQVYTTTPPTLLEAASRNVLAHLIDLQNRAVVSAEPGPLAQTRFRRT